MRVEAEEEVPGAVCDYYTDAMSNWYGHLAELIRFLQ